MGELYWDFYYPHSLVRIAAATVRSFNDLPSSINNSWRIWQNAASTATVLLDRYKAKKGSILPSIRGEEKKKNCSPSGGGGRLERTCFVAPIWYLVLYACCCTVQRIIRFFVIILHIIIIVVLLQQCHSRVRLKSHDLFCSYYCCCNMLETFIWFVGK